LCVQSVALFHKTGVYGDNVLRKVLGKNKMVRDATLSTYWRDCVHRNQRPDIF